MGENEVQVLPQSSSHDRAATSARRGASALTGRSHTVRRIDEHSTCNRHPRSEYFTALTANGLIPIEVVDLTSPGIPYSELRARAWLATGIEEPFLTADRGRSVHDLLIVADRV